MKSFTAPARAEAAPHIRRILGKRYALMAALLLAMVIVFIPVHLFVRNHALALVLLILAAFIAYIPYVRASMVNEASVADLLTRDMDPELFSCVFRRTRRKGRAYEKLELMMEVTEQFYLGEYPTAARLIRSSSIWHPSQVEYISYFVQSACAMGQSDLAQEGLSLLRQAHTLAEFRDPSQADLLSEYENLAIAAYFLLIGQGKKAEKAAREVYESDNAGELCVLYACGYLAAACAVTGNRKQAASLAQELKNYSPAFGIVRHVLGKEN